MNWIVLIIFSIAVIALIIFLVVRNKKDKEEFEEVLNEDYPKQTDEKNDEEVDDRLK